MRLITLLTCLSLCAPSLAGQLAPPAGPVAPTMKTLPEVEPRTAITQANTPGDANAIFVISLPGSYYLTDTLLGVVGKNGIRIDASSVTIDLNGFSCIGVPGSLDGIHVTPGFAEMGMYNGIISGWTGDGIEAHNNCILRDLVLVNNANGARLGDGCLVENIITQSNSGNGLELAFQGIVRNAKCVGNGGSGIRAIGQVHVIECVAVSNGAYGIFCNAEATVMACFVKSSSLDGILVGDFSRVIDSTVRLCRNGLLVGEDSIVRGCLVVSSTDHGITLRARCMAINNVANLNGTTGFCGIAVGGNDGVIDGNYVMGNANGICTSGGTSGWTIVRNIARANTGTNYSIGPGHISGTIVANPAAAGPWDNLSN